MMSGVPAVSKSDFTQQIMDFRATYLRAVARASVDLEFRRRLTAPGGDPLKVLNEAFGYVCPWDLTLELKDDPARGPRLNPAKGRVMTLPYWGEAITIYIPRRPQKYDAQLQLDALAAYYQDNPWFLRTKKEPAATGNVPAGYDKIDTGAGAEAPPTGSAAPAAEGDAPKKPIERLARDPAPPFQSKWSSVDVDRNRYDLGDNVDDFISLAAAIFNAVAVSWDNEMLWNELTAHKGEGSDFRGRTITLMREWLGYEYPWELDLIIQEDLTAEYVPYTSKGLGRWINTTPQKLMLTLPWMSGVDPTEGKTEQELKANADKAAEREVELNKKNPSVAIMGLALYNTDGAGYPFTCG